MVEATRATAGGAWLVFVVACLSARAALAGDGGPALEIILRVLAG